MNAINDKLNHIIQQAFLSLKGQLIVDAEGTILYFSPQHEKYLGIRAEDAVGRPVREVVPHTRMHIVAKTAEPECGEVFYYRHKTTGKVMPAICNRIPIYENGEVIGVMSETVFTKGFRDIKVLAKELENITEELQDSDALIPEKADTCLNKICGQSEAMMRLKKLMMKVVDFEVPLLITGETGTGKEVFATALHELSTRRDENFVKINCAAIPAELLESELFGYEPGAFSGASASGKTGKFEYAGNGTILLDEIGDMPLPLQSKLLRVIQERVFERVGGLESHPFHAQIICCTNQNLESLIKDHKFREDLYYRINALELHIPPLRERGDDIKELTEFFIRQVNVKHGLTIDGIDSKALSMFYQYSWPGNVRELQHMVQRACLLKGQGVLQPEDFPVLALKAGESNPATAPCTTLSAARARAEADAIRRALTRAKGNKTSAAEILEIDRTVLYDKIKKYHLAL